MYFPIPTNGEKQHNLFPKHTSCFSIAIFLPALPHSIHINIELTICPFILIADVFTRLDYMEKRGSDPRKMRELTEKLPKFLPGKEPQYQEATSSHTTFYNLKLG